MYHNEKIISVLLTITMLLGIISSMPLSVSAATTDVVESSNTYTDEYGEWTYEPTDNGDGYKITGYDKSMTDIEIPHVIDNLPVVEIKDKMFLRCSSLTSVTIPNSITTIGNSAFYGCSNLTSVTLSDRVTAIGNFTFANCSSLTNITIPNSVTAIGDRAFYDCSSLTSVTIPNSVTSIGDYAFRNCSSLISVTIPNSVTSIERYAFYGCSSLMGITIPDGVTSIEIFTFKYCTNLKDVFYIGSKSEWDDVSIKPGNDELKNATIHYNYTPPITGDISGDGILAVNDVIFVLKNIVGNQELTAEQLALADVSDDGKLTILDAILLQKLVLEMV